MVPPEADRHRTARVLRIKADAFPCCPSPSAEHVADVLEFSLAVHVPIEVVDTEIVRESDEYFGEIERALQAIEEEQAFGERKRVRFPGALDECEYLRLQGFAERVPFCFRVLADVSMQELVPLIQRVDQRQLIVGSASEPAIKWCRGGGRSLSYNI